MNFLKASILGLATSSLLALTACTADSNTKDFEDLKQEVSTEMKTLDNDIKELKAEAQGNDLEAEKQAAIDEVEEMYEDFKSDWNQVKEESGESYEKAKERIRTQLVQLKKKTKQLIN